MLSGLVIRLPHVVFGALSPRSPLFCQRAGLGLSVRARQDGCDHVATPGVCQGIRALYIDELNVSTHFRGFGLAKRPLTFAEKVARAEQRPFLKLTVALANAP
jgi:hypothetical protein